MKTSEENPQEVIPLSDTMKSALSISQNFLHYDDLQPSNLIKAVPSIKKRTLSSDEESIDYNLESIFREDDYFKTERKSTIGNSDKLKILHHRNSAARLRGLAL